jgi:hypothetical protein
VASKEALVTRVSAFPDADPLWRVERFAEWASISVPAVYYQIAKGRIPGVVRFGKTIRIDPAVAIPALHEAVTR